MRSHQSQSILDQLIKLEKSEAFAVLTRAVQSRSALQIKPAGSQKVLNIKLHRSAGQRNFRIISDLAESLAGEEVTVKVILDSRLFFIKSTISYDNHGVFLSGYENFFELVRRRRPRFRIPNNWSQQAVIHALDASYEIKSKAQIIELSAEGMKLAVNPELPRYEKNQNIKVFFKVFRRAEVVVNARVIHVKKNTSSGPTIGVQFAPASNLVRSKIQNVCDDLAFFYAAASAAV